jgi:hypothetical protein
MESFWMSYEKNFPKDLEGPTQASETSERRPEGAFPMGRGVQMLSTLKEWLAN